MATSTFDNDEPPRRTNTTLIEKCLGVEVKTTLQGYAMILYDHANAEPSCIERCLCHCSPKKRAPSGIADVPEIANRSGVFFQYGDHSTANTAMTLKGAVFDKGNRVADLKAYGGFGGEASTVGAWTAEKSSTWLCLMTIARLCNYTYRFKFSEDWQRADIEIRGNLCCVTGAPCCCKPWFSIPD